MCHHFFFCLCCLYLKADFTWNKVVCNVLSFTFKILDTWKQQYLPKLVFCCCSGFFDLCWWILLYILIFLFSVYRWWPPGNIDAFCCAAGTVAVDMVPVTEARWPWSSQHPQQGRGNACKPGIGERLSQAPPASD